MGVWWLGWFGLEGRSRSAGTVCGSGWAENDAIVSFRFVLLACLLLSIAFSMLDSGMQNNWNLVCIHCPFLKEKRKEERNEEMENSLENRWNRYSGVLGLSVCGKFRVWLDITHQELSCH